MMRSRQVLLAGILVVPLSFGIASVAAAPESGVHCLVKESGITEVINGWETSHLMRVSASIRQAIIADFCQSTLDVQAQRSLPVSLLEDATQPTVVAFLDRSANPSVNDIGMEAILQNHLGYHGLAAPKPKRWGLLKVNYRQSVDRMNIGGDIFEPVENYMLEIGSHAIVGMRALHTVCSGSVEVRSGQQNNFDC